MTRERCERGRDSSTDARRVMQAPAAPTRIAATASSMAAGRRSGIQSSPASPSRAWPRAQLCCSVDGLRGLPRLLAAADDDPFTEVLNRSQKYVASRTLEEPLRGATRASYRARPQAPWPRSRSNRETISSSRQRRPRRDATRHALADEYVLRIHPLVRVGTPPVRRLGGRASRLVEEGNRRSPSTPREATVPMTERLARASSRRPWLVVGLWLIVILAAFVLVATLLAFEGEAEITSTTESKQADRILAEGFPQEAANGQATHRGRRRPRRGRRGRNGRDA